MTDWVAQLFDFVYIPANYLKNSTLIFTFLPLPEQPETREKVFAAQFAGYHGKLLQVLQGFFHRIGEQEQVHVLRADHSDRGHLPDERYQGA